VKGFGMAGEGKNSFLKAAFVLLPAMLHWSLTKTQQCR
jgi:hypothetical protein